MIVERIVVNSTFGIWDIGRLKRNARIIATKQSPPLYVIHCLKGEECSRQTGTQMGEVFTIACVGDMLWPTMPCWLVLLYDRQTDFA